MELWIRTQSKQSLVKVNNISINVQDRNRYIIDSNDYILGRYKSYARALEVLDDIQNFICIEIYEDDIDYEEADLILKGKIVDSLYKVYQMPKE